MFQKRTLRKLPPFTRKIARMINDAEKAIGKLKKALPDIQRLELDSAALWNQAKHRQQKGEVDGEGLDWLEQSALSKATK